MDLKLYKSKVSLIAYNKFIFISCICCIAILPLLIPGIPKGHDLTFHLSRILAIKEGLMLGQFPVRIYPGYLENYGYANGLFYPDLFLYIPALFCFFGMNIILAYKLFLFICTWSTAFSMFTCIEKISNSNLAAIVSTILYVYSAYRMVDIYERAAVGEILAFIFIPIIILGLYELIYRDYKKWYILTLGMTGVFFSHTISSVISIIIIGFIVLITFRRLFKEPIRILGLLQATIYTLLLTAYFLFPLLEQIVNTDFILTTQTILSEVWNTTIPLWNLFLEIPWSVFFLGGFSGIGTVFLLIYIYRIKYKFNKNDIYMFSDMCLFISFILLVATTDLFPWEWLLKYFKILGSIQFSWRMNLFITAFLSISGGIIVSNVYNRNKNRKHLIIVFVLAGIAAGSNISANYLAYGYYQIKGLYSLNTDKFSIGLGEYLPVGTDLNKIISRGDVVTSNNEIDIKYKRMGNKILISFDNNIYDNTYIEIPLVYYLGYDIKCEQIEFRNDLQLLNGDNNIIRVELSSVEKGNFTVFYKGTKIQKISLIISLLGLISVLMCIKRKDVKMQSVTALVYVRF